MVINRQDLQIPAKGPIENFTGDVTIISLVQTTEPSRVSAAQVTFSPGAHSNWHRHPLGQTLIVTEGTGWIQSEGGKKEEINSGDVVWCPPNEKHWHGATLNSFMTHIAIQETLDGKMIEWLEPVSDEEYKA